MSNKRGCTFAAGTNSPFSKSYKSFIQCQRHTFEYSIEEKVVVHRRRHNLSSFLLFELNIRITSRSPCFGAPRDANARYITKLTKVISHLLLEEAERNVRDVHDTARISLLLPPLQE